MKVAVAMSGGMDSTAAAMLLRNQGHDVFGFHIYMHEYSRRSWEAVQEIARRTAIPISLVDLSHEFQDIVISHFIREYSRGRTPSPCLLCNKFIKMGLLRQHARTFGCDMLATGHYARVIRMGRSPELRKGIDPKKDQSYFLAMVPPQILDKVILPLGAMTKSQTREMLEKMGVQIPRSEESQELCFIRGETYKDYLLTHGIAPQPGPVVDVHGHWLGTHGGIVGFTVGQRRGMRISAEHPLYVIAIDSQSNTIVVGTAEQTYVKAIEVEQFNMLREKPIEAGEVLRVKVRSTSAPTLCMVASLTATTVNLQFHKPQRGVAPGQAAVLYADDQVVGGGWIRTSIRSPGSQ